ncbi:TonB-dependent receptor plug domain-containing protein [Granulosicoccus antarcticus]|uniref:Colicin I receptor n=1 Tax=Granulosicoccus antarcticus IMCC3135 TaxID=1192854 RepID=A0A2Z2P3D0_9GAMM|nr:TonB-dependent receptor [Granulosicoccus antarcticus]ASJ76888.1 Colicin I receptor [Granulosicoccus antarcticus IMCC3135]
MHKLWFGMPLLGLSLAFPTSYANTDDMVLDTLVITGTRTERKLLDVPVRTEVISRESIEQSHARDLSEALRLHPGVLLKDIHGKNGTEVWIQGLNSDRVLVLLNGRPISASTGSTVDLTQIATADVERIEIVKGALSALYGSSAMGGVVNVITREPQGPASYELQIDTGSFGDKKLEGDGVLGRRHVNASASRVGSHYKASLMADIRDSDGYDLDPDTYSFDGGRGSKLNVVAEISYLPTDRSTFTYSTSWYDEDTDRNFSTFAPGQGDIEKLDIEQATRFNQTLSWEHQFGEGKNLKGFILSEKFSDITEQDVVLTPVVDQRRIAEIDTLQAELQFDWPISESQMLTMGAVGIKRQLEQRQERSAASEIIQIDEITPGAEQDNIELFFQNDIFVGDRWELVPGLRYQNDSDFGSHLAPKINVLYTPVFAPKLNPRVRFGIGSGYRVPNLKERFYLFDHSSNGYVVLGNTSLKPESSESIQASFEMSLNESTRAEIALFHNRFEDLISTSLDAESSDSQQLQVYRYDNISSARTQGFDVSVVHKLGEQWKLDAAYTLLDAEDLETGLSLTQRPEHQINLGVERKFSDLGSSLNLKAGWQSEQFVDQENETRSPAYTVVDIKYTQPAGKHLTWFAGIENLLDEHLEPSSGGSDLRPKEGRFVYAGLRYKH